MKYVKMLGFAAVAAAALMAFVAAATASATVLCKTTPTSGKCPANQAWPAGTEIHAVNVGTVFLHTSYKTLECKKSTLKGPTINEGSATETVAGIVEVFTLEECVCEVVVLTANGLGIVSVHSLANHNGTLLVSGQEVTVQCQTIFGPVHCIYVTNNKDLGEVTAGNPAIFHAETTIERKITNALCGEEATFTATYEVTSPKPLYFANST